MAEEGETQSKMGEYGTRTSADYADGHGDSIGRDKPELSARVRLPCADVHAPLMVNIGADETCQVFSLSSKSCTSLSRLWWPIWWMLSYAICQCLRTVFGKCARPSERLSSAAQKGLPPYCIEFMQNKSCEHGKTVPTNHSQDCRPCSQNPFCAIFTK